MTVVVHYKNLNTRSSEVLEHLAADHDVMPSFTVAHNFTAEHESLGAAISNRPESQVWKLANREYQFALYATATGMYRHATLSLRLFFELALATIQFSAYEIKLRQWLANSSDINWNSLSNPDTGVFSRPFICAFSDGLEEYGPQYAKIATTTYRECSEFVHGNFNTHGDIAAPLGYDKDMAIAWIERAKSIQLCVLFAFACRYLKYVDQDARNSLEPLMLENLGYIQEIRESFEQV